MITIRQENERGQSKLNWLDSKHTFSFAHYADNEQMGYGPLRVINEDKVNPGAGFNTHGHKNMEILSYVIKGAIEHKDNTGMSSVIKRGEIQRMSAGTGILHSEFNHSKTELVHFLQIWIEPNQLQLKPGYEQKLIDPLRERNQLSLIGSPTGSESAVQIHQDAYLYLGELDAGYSLEYSIAKARGLWLQVIAGEIKVNTEKLGSGDGALIENESCIQISAVSDAEFILFNLPATL